MKLNDLQTNQQFQCQTWKPLTKINLPLAQFKRLLGTYLTNILTDDFINDIHKDFNLVLRDPKTGTVYTLQDHKTLEVIPINTTNHNDQPIEETWAFTEDELDHPENTNAKDIFITKHQNYYYQRNNIHQENTNNQPIIRLHHNGPKVATLLKVKTNQSGQFLGFVK